MLIWTKELELIKFAYDFWDSYGLEMPVSVGDTLGLVGDAGYGIHLHVQVSTSLTNTANASKIADGTESAENTHLLETLMLSGSVYGPGGLTFSQLTEGDHVTSLNADTGDIPGQYSPAALWRR